MSRRSLLVVLHVLWMLGVAAAAGPSLAEAAPSNEPARRAGPARKPSLANALPAGSARSGGRPAARASLETMPLPPEGDPDRDRIRRMQEGLRQLLHGRPLASLRVGMRVIDAQTGRLFFAHRPAALMDPASNQKVLATATALMRLGPDWRFRTELQGPLPDGDGVIHGDLYLRGSGDPSLTPGALHRLAEALAARGVTRIEGAVTADPRRIAARDEGPDRRPAILVNRGGLAIRVRPTTPGERPEVNVRVARASVVVENRALTRARGRGRVSASVRIVDGRLVVTVTGRIAVGRRPVIIRRGVPQPALYAAVLLHDALEESGITATGRPRVQAASVRAPLLVAHRSEPLLELVRRTNKPSDNEYAERIMEAVGAEVYGGAATREKGIRVLREVMTELGLSPSGYVPVNGSGLGHANRISAEAMAELLHRLYLDPRVGPEIVQSLSVGGVDGTTRNRFRGSPAAKRVRSKTGTLRGKSSLSGYVGDGQDVLVFAVLVEGFRKRSLNHVRAAQVGAVNVLMRYVQDAKGRHEPPTGPEGVIELPGIDYETGEGPGEEGEDEEVEEKPEAEPVTPPDPAELDRVLERARARDEAPR